MRPLVITNLVTRRDERSMEKYFNEISKFEVLTPAQETELFKRLKEGDEQVLTKIIAHNLRFVVSVAKQYQHTGLWLGDLINEGNIGLIKAARRFDITKGFKFISYAVWWIRQSIIQAINEKGRKIRLPLNHQSNVSKIRKARIRLLQENEREPTISELARATDLSTKMVALGLSTYEKCQSLDAPVGSDGDVSLGALMEDHTVPEPDFNLAKVESQKQTIQHLLGELPSNESIVISLFFGIERKNPMTLHDIGEQIGVSRERVRQIKERGLKRLRRNRKTLEIAI